MRRLPPARAVVFVLAACVGCTSTSTGTDPGASNGIPASPTPPVELAPVDGLAIREPSWSSDGSDWALELTWEPPADVAIDHYVVSRDGAIVQDELTEPTWSDPDAEPNARYRYAVVAVDIAGTSSLPASASIETGGPALAQARLQGSFVVRMRARHSRGIDDPVSGGDLVFRFAPRCATGPCPVVWTVASHPTQALLRQRGTLYGRNARSPFLIRNCFGRGTDEDLAVRLRVRDAAAIGGRWLVTSFTGAIEETSRFSGCGRAWIHWSLRGEIQT